MNTDRKMTPADVAILESIVNDTFGVKISKRTRKREYVDARRVFYKILRDKGMVLTKIGSIYSQDHSTIVHGLQMFEDLYVYDKTYRDSYNIVLDKFTDYMNAGVEVGGLKGDMAVFAYKEAIEKSGTQKEVSRLKKENAELLARLEARERYHEITSMMDVYELTDEELDLVKIKIRGILNGLK